MGIEAYRDGSTDRSGLLCVTAGVGEESLNRFGANSRSTKSFDDLELPGVE
jgi:hypothetical protein